MVSGTGRLFQEGLGFSACGSSGLCLGGGLELKFYYSYFLNGKEERRWKTLDLMTLVSGPLLGCGLVGLCVVVSLGLGWVIENKHCFIHYF